VYYYKKAFDEVSQKVITSEFPQAIAVTDDEALTFCLNSMIVGNTIVTNTNAVAFTTRVKKDGYEVIQTDMSEFLKSGGSVKCLTNEIWESV
jgi:N-dimethylarginine dimethylaminohydrolase